MEVLKNHIRVARIEDLKSIQEIFEATIRSVCKKDYNAEQIDAWAAGARGARNTRGRAGSWKWARSPLPS